MNTDSGLVIMAECVAGIWKRFSYVSSSTVYSTSVFGIGQLQRWWGIYLEPEGMSGYLTSFIPKVNDISLTKNSMWSG